MELTDKITNVTQKDKQLLIEYDNGCVFYAQKRGKRVEWSPDKNSHEVEADVYCVMVPLDGPSWINKKRIAPEEKGELWREYETLEERAREIYQSEIDSLDIETVRYSERRKQYEGCINLVAMPFVATIQAVYGAYEVICNKENSFRDKVFAAMTIPVAAFCYAFLGYAKSGREAYYSKDYLKANNQDNIHKNKKGGDPAILIEGSPNEFHHGLPAIAFSDELALDQDGLSYEKRTIQSHKKIYRDSKYFLSIDPDTKQELYDLVEKQKELKHKWLTFRDEIKCGDHRGMLESYNFISEDEKIVWGGSDDAC